MRKLLLVFTIVCAQFQSFAQEEISAAASVEQSLWSLQGTLFGVWFTNEAKFSDEVVLRSQVGLTGGYTQGYVTDYNYLYMLIPEIEIEPRWYHSIKSRAEKGRHTSNNSADYVSLKTTFQPDWFTIGNDHKDDVISSLALAGNAGMRREIWNNFSFELAAGVGVAYDLEDQNADDFFLFPDFHFLLSYSF
ncbi:hypothetical protein DSM03_101159 [Leeuwenhoekiella aestuarii]|uniref:Outer membrane protein with beta-barrel domain n=1 Tax=Leeuwenhoekiella aestuarii TaxID=2249426 RepID=A0A4Q0NUZ3_9FLAO|nr:hypothetical protein [Leeuwenhoekiella aestuarii]RXG14044.1 hypothetical protein DSM04_104150 [Leeuwenhoekiella aestuarii]RXG18793.1 hypothetical protein DSM03_101159 [Leeuwenhoekiella aestuarii]